jgi:nitrous oxide reductase accessory protein NosL
MDYDFLVCYIDKSGEQASVPFTSLSKAKKFAMKIGGLVISLKG